MLPTLCRTAVEHTEPCCRRDCPPWSPRFLDPNHRYIFSCCLVQHDLIPPIAVGSLYRQASDIVSSLTNATFCLSRNRRAAALASLRPSRLLFRFLLVLYICFLFIACRTLWLYRLARCLSFFMGGFNPPTPTVSAPPTLLCVTTPCTALLILPRLSPRRSPLLLGRGVRPICVIP